MPLRKKEVAKALRETHGVITRAARKLGVARETLSRYVSKHPDLQRVRDEAKEALVDLAEEGLVEALEKRRPWAVQFTLARLGKDRGYTERTEQEQVGEIRVKVIREDA